MSQIIIKIDLTENDAFSDDELGEVLRIVKNVGAIIERDYSQLFSPFQRKGKGAKFTIFDYLGAPAGSIQTKNG